MVASLQAGGSHLFEHILVPTNKVLAHCKLPVMEHR
jgi:hypothetical protein